MSATDETPFVPASELLENRSRQPRIDAKHTRVEYADGTRALAIYPADDGDDTATSAWISALGDSFVDPEEMR